MRVKWTQYMRLSINSIPEMYWGEDLSQFVNDYEGEVIGTTRSFFGDTYLVVACTDGQVREVNIRNVKTL
jgi:hypothetical protein